MNDCWRIFLEGLEFIFPGNEAEASNHCGHVVQCPNGHYAILRIPDGTNPRTVAGSLLCHRCKREWPTPRA